MTKTSRLAADSDSGAASAPARESRPMFTLPERFTASPDRARGMVTISDSETGKEARIAAGSFGEVRRTLGALFGGIEEEASPGPRNDAEQAAAAPRTKKLFGAALKSRDARAGRDASPGGGKPAADRPARGPDPVQPEMQLGEPVPVAAAAGRESIEILPAAPRPDGIPDGWAPEIPGEGYLMRFMLDPENGAPGYSVWARGNEVARARMDAPAKFHLRSLDGSFDPTPHRNVFGVKSRLDVVLEDAAA